MATMNVNLTDEMRVCVDALVKSGEYQSNSDYVRALIRADLDRRAASRELDVLLDEGLRGPFHAFDEKSLCALEEVLLGEVEQGVAT